MILQPPAPIYSLRFNHPTDAVLLTSGLLAVADYSNNRVRLVDINRDEVTTLCYGAAASDCVFNGPMALAVSSNLKRLYVGTVSSLLQLSECPCGHGNRSSGFGSLDLIFSFSYSWFLVKYELTMQIILRYFWMDVCPIYCNGCMPYILHVWPIYWMSDLYCMVA